VNTEDACTRLIDEMLEDSKKRLAVLKEEEQKLMFQGKIFFGVCLLAFMVVLAMSFV
jgi:hypothetical protein